MPPGQRDARQRIADTAKGSSSRLATHNQDVEHGGRASKGAATKKTVSFADEKRKVAKLGAEEDPAAYHAYGDTPANLCSLSLRIASKGMAQTSVISIVILAYCCVLCWASPVPQAGTAEFWALRVVSYMSIVVWTVEIAAKIAGFGLRPFFRNKWNLLDCACLVSLCLDVAAFPGVSFAYFRLLKVARPLLHYKVFEQIQWMIDGVCHSFTLLPPILSLTAIFMFLCAVLGSQLFGSSGVLYNRCVKPADKAVGGWGASRLSERMRRSAEGGGEELDSGSTEMTNELGAGQEHFKLVLPEAHCDNATGLVLGKYSCDTADGQVCRKIEAMTPFGGLESYDNALSALLVVVLAILQQKYDHVFTGTTDASGDASGLYFLVLTLVGVFFLLNFTTASLTLAYAQTCKESPSNHMGMENYDSAETTQATTAIHSESHGVGSARVKGNQGKQSTENRSSSRERVKDDNEGAEGGEKARHIDKEVNPLSSATDNGEHALLRGVVSARQFYEQCSQTLLSRYVRGSHFIAQVWGPCVRPFAVIVAYPNPVDASADLCNTAFCTTPYSEVLVRLAALVHTGILASVSHRSSEEDVAALHLLDTGFICFFAVVEGVRICGYAGVLRYLRKSWSHTSDLSVSVVTTIVWWAGASNRFQLGSLRAMRLSLLVWDFRIFRRAKHVLMVSFGQNSEMPLATAVVILGYIICSFVLFQLFHEVELDNERQMFKTFPSTVISLLEITAGDSLRDMILQAYRDLGFHAVILVIVICFLVKHVINKALTAVVLHNLVSPDPDKVWYQLQFERLSWLYGWTGSEKNYHWLHTRDHSELLMHGEKQILIPDIAGVFERVVADENLHVSSGRNSHGTGVVDGSVAILSNMHAAAHKTMNLDLKYTLSVRVVRCSDLPIEGSFVDKSMHRVRLEIRDVYPEMEDIQVVDSRLSGPPLPGADMKWADDFTFNQISNDAVLEVSIVNERQGGEVFLGRTKVCVRSFSSEAETIRSLHLMDAEDIVLGSGIKSAEAGADDTTKLITLHLKSELDFTPNTVMARIRLRLKNFISSDAFELFIFFMIVSCIILSIVEFELRGYRTLHRTVDVVFIIVFSAEALFKMLGLGLWHDPDAYLRSGWNIFDLFVTVWMSVAFALDGGDTLNVYALRFFRILRPMLQMERFQGFQIAVRALYRAGGVLLLILITQLGCLFTVSVSCLWAFRGRLKSCNDPDLDGQWDCLAFFEQENGFLLPRSWSSPKDSFDSIVDALLACYRTLNRSGWLEVVEEVMHASDEDQQRQSYRSEANALPFLAIELSCNLILFQAMMSIMINAIDVTRGQALMTSSQKVFESSVFLVDRAKHEFVRFVQKEGIEWLQEVVLHNYFEAITTCVIMINIIVLLFESYSAPPAQREFLHAANVIFVYFYAVEQAIKITAFSWAYFLPKINGSRCLSYTNIFDFAVSLASFLEITLLTGTGTGINLLRSFRALRLLNAINSIRQILVAASTSASTVLGCFGLFMVFIVAFAVMGVPVFHDVKRGLSLTRVTHFDTVKAGIVVLTRTAAGEDWPALMYELSVQPPKCHMPPNQSWIEYYAEKMMSPGHSRGDCGSNFAYPFFCVFSFLCKFAFLPLFSASMISTFLQHVGQQAAISSSDVTLYTKVWGQLDKKGSGHLPAWKLKHLIDRLHAEGSVVAFDTIRMPRMLEKTRSALDNMRDAKPSYQSSAEIMAAQRAIRRAEAAASAARTAQEVKTLKIQHTKTGASATDKSKMLMNFDDVLVVLVSLKFFESAVLSDNSRDYEPWHDIVRLWARDANAKALRVSWLRQSGADLPVQGYRLHTWVHSCFMLAKLQNVPLFVRVIVEEPGGIISGDTQTVSGKARSEGGEEGNGDGYRKVNLNGKLSDAEIHTWEQDIILDFNGHEDTVIIFEVYNGKSKAIVGRCSERLKNLSHEHLATRSMDIYLCDTDKNSAANHLRKLHSVGRLTMTCCWIAPVGEDGVVGRSADDVKNGKSRIQGWVLMGQGSSQLQRDSFREDSVKGGDVSSLYDAPSDIDDFDVEGNSPRKTVDPAFLLDLASYQEAVQDRNGMMGRWTKGAASQVRSILGLQPDEEAQLRARNLQRDYMRRNYLFSEAPAGGAGGLGASAGRSKQLSLKSEMQHKRENERRKVAQKALTADRSSRVPQLRLNAEAKWREVNSAREEEAGDGGNLGTWLGFLSPRSVRTDVEMAEEVQGVTPSPSHWLSKSTSRRLSQRYSHATPPDPLQYISTPRRGVSLAAGLQMLDAQGNYFRPGRRLWLADEADTKPVKREVQWWLAHGGHSEEVIGQRENVDEVWTSDKESTSTTETGAVFKPQDIPDEPPPWERVPSGAKETPLGNMAPLGDLSALRPPRPTENERKGVQGPLRDRRPCDSDDFDLSVKPSPRNYEMSWSSVKTIEKPDTRAPRDQTSSEGATRRSKGPATVMSRRSAPRNVGVAVGDGLKGRARSTGPRRVFDSETSPKSEKSKHESERGTDDSERAYSSEGDGTATPPGSPSDSSDYDGHSPRTAFEQNTPGAKTGFGFITALGLGGEPVAVSDRRPIVPENNRCQSGNGEAVVISGGPTQGPEPLRFSADGMLLMAGGWLTPRGGWMGGGSVEMKERGTVAGEAVATRAVPAAKVAKSKDAAAGPEASITFSPARRSQGFNLPKRNREGDREKLTGRKRVA